MDIANDYRSAAEAFVDLVARIPDDAWDRPALGVWNVRDLVGHGTRSLILPRAYAVADEIGEPDLASAAIYFRVALASVTDWAAVAQRGRDAGAALGDHPKAAVAQERADTIAALGAPGHVRTPWGTMRSHDYLATRVVELVIHGDDLARAMDLPFPIGSGPVRLAAGILAELASMGDGLPLLRALTGRAPLPAGYSVL